MAVPGHVAARPRDVLELIAFEISGQAFAVRTVCVREIRGWAPCMRLPQTPPDVLGVMNLRGAVVPIIDLSRRLGYGGTEPTARSAVVVVEVGHCILGLLVEQVSDMLSVDSSDIRPVPEVASAEEAGLIEGIITRGAFLACLIDLGVVLPEAGQQGIAA